MKESFYSLWIDYHSGNINRALTEREYSEIRACDFSMHLLIPTKALLKMCGGLNKLKQMDIYHNNDVIRKMALAFRVPEEVMFFKMDYIIKQENNNKFIKRILKKKKQ